MSDTADVLGNLKLAIYAKFVATTEGVHNAFYTAVNGRLYEGETDDSDYPYATYSIISSPKDRTFSEEYRNTLVQFDFYSNNMDSSEIDDIYYHASALFDECSLSITGSTLVWMREENFIGPLIENTPEDSGSGKILHSSADFEIRTSLN